MSAFMLTHSAREHHLSGCRILGNRIDIHDVAHALSTINRYTGHATRPFSVAEHSLLVEEFARRDNRSPVVRLACLMHDGHEAFTGDVGTPQKQAIGPSWYAFEAKQADIFRRQFGLVTTFQTHRDLINLYDLMALATERRDVTNYDARRNDPWPVLDTPHEEVPAVSPTVVNLNDMTRCARSWRDWRDHFLEQFFLLSRLVHATEPTPAE